MTVQHLTLQAHKRPKWASDPLAELQFLESIRGLSPEAVLQQLTGSMQGLQQRLARLQSPPLPQVAPQHVVTWLLSFKYMHGFKSLLRRSPVKLCDTLLVQPCVGRMGVNLCRAITCDSA